ncbi:EMB2745 [Symbiodinium pilosum]|uniref:EMB2745 protein n=1 Tax=Symbiodinium pilosum TaxID=2952 RepID=A0A812TFV9_SYMPI|nr:EMB2745 [Symbiodinium pilosum]
MKAMSCHAGRHLQDPASASDFKALGVSVGLVVLNTLVDACCRAGDMKRAAALLQDMVHAKFDLQPDLISYSTLIKGYCVQGDLDDALELFGAMRRKGIKPDAIVFNSLLDGCARKEMPMLCEQVIEDMVAAGVQPSNYSASILIKLYGRISDLDAAFKVLDEMPQKFGFRPNTAVYTTLMSSCTWNGRMDLAMGLRERMLQDGQTADEKTFLTLLRGATRFGQCEHISTLLWEVAEQSMRQRKPLVETEVVQNALHTLMKRRAWNQQGGEECLQHLRCAGFNVVRPQVATPAKGNSQRRLVSRKC